MTHRWTMDGKEANTSSSLLPESSSSHPGTLEAEDALDTWTGSESTYLMARLLVASFNAGTFLSLAFFLYVMYSKVEIGHPVFAVVFQEVCILFLSQTIAFLTSLFLGIPLTLDENVPIFVLSAFTLQFHQWSWLVISCLRYYLIVMVKPTQNQCIRSLKVKALVLVWCAISIHGAFFVLFAVHWRWGFRNDSGEVDPSEESLARFQIVLYTLMYISLPDIGSLVLYSTLRRRQKYLVQPAAPMKEENDTNNREEGQQLAAGVGVFPADVGMPGGPPPPPPPQPPEQQQDEQVSRFMRALRLNAITSLMDLSLLTMSFIPEPNAKLIIVQVLPLVASYWIPLLVIKINFKQMDNMLQTFFILVC